jgi:hypothetical protein
MKSFHGRSNHHNYVGLCISTKAWKAFVKELDAMQKKLKKNDAAGALAVLDGASAALDAYLAEVELPPVAELK